MKDCEKLEKLEEITDHLYDIQSLLEEIETITKSVESKMKDVGVYGEYQDALVECDGANDVGLLILDIDEHKEGLEEDE